MTTSDGRAREAAGCSDRHSSYRRSRHHPRRRPKFQHSAPQTAEVGLGTGKVDGVVSNVVGLLRPQFPAWFRIWVGRGGGLVRRQDMLAEAHIMDHRYVGFDEALDIRPSI